MGRTLHLGFVQFPEVIFNSSESDRDITNDLTLDMNLNASLNKDDVKSFVIKFNLNFKHKENKLSLRITAFAHFKSNTDVDEAFLNSDFGRINAPAIAFPYIRAYVSNFLMNAGFNPVFLPSFNFVELDKKTNEQKSLSETSKDDIHKT